MLGSFWPHVAALGLLSSRREADCVTAPGPTCGRLHKFPCPRCGREVTEVLLAPGELFTWRPSKWSEVLGNLRWGRFRYGCGGSFEGLFTVPGKMGSFRRGSGLRFSG